MTSAKPVQQSQPASNADPRWTAIATRDKRSDGKFFYSVRTTGVYCRPSCPARPARRENVEFHATAEEAARAGFRPCKRCRPDRNSRADAALRAAIVQHWPLTSRVSSRTHASASIFRSMCAAQPFSNESGGHCGRLARGLP